MADETPKEPQALHPVWSVTRMTRERLNEILDDEAALTADGFDEAILGLVHVWMPVEKDGKMAGCTHRHLVLYDRRRCIRLLVERDGMLEEDAEEYFEVNVIGAYVGPLTPAFAYIDYPDDEQEPKGGEA